MESISVFAPATVANLGSGFDVMGLAITKPGDRLVLRKNNLGKVQIKSIQGDGGRLSLNPEKNTASVTILRFLESIDSRQGFDLELYKEMPLGSGLGSSAASSVAGVFAANALLGFPLSNTDLLPYAMEGERIACGTAHADNVAPCLLGGVVLVGNSAPLLVKNLPFSEDLVLAVVHPHIEVNTRDARAVLPTQIPLSQAVEQWAKVASLAAGFCQNDVELIRNGLTDPLIEPLRAKLTPGFQLVKQAALDAGALGCSISGSGPSVFAFFTAFDNAKSASKKMQAEFSKLGIQSDAYISGINRKGPEILD